MRKVATNSYWLKRAMKNVERGTVFALSPHDRARIDEITAVLDCHDTVMDACQFAVDWLESYNIPRQVTGDERDEVLAKLTAALNLAGWQQ
jgi:hypothetical protein